ncbi:peptidylprolyl isomerase [Roseateles koreensis]|uniref:peptidylprolyl isomerase n=1 Tax=Roseateles koreensis TaxID=2987526 RepID=A0ABT5KTA1_9BURK|nr:peptidylprolyl isomerase [Roseateles koreensis]MDC8786072.1 peptidylprolyl isomerase [Roseateles koreensis]
MSESQHGCGGGGGGCGCKSSAAVAESAPAHQADQGHHGHHGHSAGFEDGLPQSSTSIEALMAEDAAIGVASVNGVPLHGVGESPDPEALRQRAYSELLRQAAQRKGLLAVGDLPALDGVLSEEASLAIEALLAQELRLPEPDAAACQRYFDAHPARFSVGEQVLARHILFAVTPGVDVDALRKRAEQSLVALRCSTDDGGAAFAAAAASQSNCPSSAQGGNLGWLSRADCAPEFGAALFAQDEANAHVGVLPRLISSRFGFHIVWVMERQPGQPQRFDQVHSAIAQTLRQQTYVTALRQYLNSLAGEAHWVGLSLDESTSPLVQ